MRRFLAIVGVFALAVAYLPGVVGALYAAQQPSCCLGPLCPMHHKMNQQSLCDMGPGNKGAQMQACPASIQHYAAFVFVRSLAPTLFGECLVQQMSISVSTASPSNTAHVDSPPPRSLSA